jgi:hypothetical protein
MESKTEAEIERCQKFLQRSDISEHDREAAERGLNDWFLQSVMEEFGASDDWLFLIEPQKS